MADVPILRRVQLVALRPNASEAEIEELCSQAKSHECLGVCVTPVRVEIAASRLEDTDVRVCALVGFPFGTSEPDVKTLEVENAIEAGAREIEFVVHPGWLRDQNDRAILREMRDLREAAQERPVTAVIEAGLVTPEDVRRACHLVLDAELQFVATATGCAGRAMTPDDVKQIREWVGPELGIKAVGGVGDPAIASALVGAGANRIAVLDPAPFLNA